MHILKSIIKLALALCLGIFPFLSYSQTEVKEPTNELKSLTAKRIASTIKIDGKLDEEQWKDAEIATYFTQRWPRPGEKNTQNTRTTSSKFAKTPLEKRVNFLSNELNFI